MSRRDLNVYCPSCGCCFKGESGYLCPCCEKAELALCKKIDGDADVAKVMCGCEEEK